MHAHAALSAINHLLSGADWARQRLRAFARRTLRLSLPPLEFIWVVDAEGYFAATPITPASVFDVSIELPAQATLAILEGADAVLRAARIEGNAEFAQTVGFVLRNLHWDYEEDLSRLIGDVAAHRLVSHAAGWLRGQGDAARKLGENLAEYLREERALCVSTSALHAFSDDLRQLAARLDALEQRIGNTPLR